MNPKFIQELSKILDIDESGLTLDLRLDTCQWDSISAVQFITTADLMFDAKIDLAALKNCTTVGDLIRLLPDNLNDN